MKKKAADLSDLELVEYSRKHLLYEMQMLIGCAKISHLKVAGAHIAWTLTNLPTEGFALHLRNLVDFLYPRRRDPYPTDVLAKHFVIEGTALPPLSASLHIARQRADREMGHLTTGRRDDSDPEKLWPKGKLLQEVFSVLESFAEICRPTKTAPEVRQCAFDSLGHKNGHNRKIHRKSRTT